MLRIEKYLEKSGRKYGDTTFLHQNRRSKKKLNQSCVKIKDTSSWSYGYIKALIHLPDHVYYIWPGDIMMKHNY